MLRGMRSDVQTDYDWAARFMPHVRCILGQHLIRDGTRLEDCEHCGDLRILRLGLFDMEIGVRIRRQHYWPKYAEEFTIRASRPTGTKTELEKICREARCTWFFYGFAADDSCLLRAYHLVDIAKLRPWLVRNWETLPRQCNGDGTTFVPIQLSAIPQNCILVRAVLKEGHILGRQRQRRLVN